MKGFLVFIALFAISISAFGQNLMSERIRKIEDKKKSLYFEKGVFHNGANKIKSGLKAVRHSFSAQQGYERIVLDFSSDKVPKIYGYISPNEKRLYMDLFNTDLVGEIKSFGNSKFVESINFYPLDKESLSVEITFKERVSMDTFQLASHGRLVVDVKK